jgi:hypothetical protein
MRFYGQHETDIASDLFPDQTDSVEHQSMVLGTQLRLNHRSNDVRGMRTLNAAGLDVMGRRTETGAGVLWSAMRPSGGISPMSSQQGLEAANVKPKLFQLRAHMLP